MQGCGAGLWCRAVAPGGDAHDLADQLQNLGLQQNLADSPPAAYRVFTFDTEATDRDTSSAGIWEIAMVDLTTRQHFQQMLNPGPAYRMSARAAQITGGTSLPPPDQQQLLGCALFHLPPCPLHTLPPPLLPA
jgi:hypothetical protein